MTHYWVLVGDSLWVLLDDSRLSSGRVYLLSTLWVLSSLGDSTHWQRKTGHPLILRIINRPHYHWQYLMIIRNKTIYSIPITFLVLYTTLYISSMQNLSFDQENAHTGCIGEIFENVSNPLPLVCAVSARWWSSMIHSNKSSAKYNIISTQHF